jgi:ferredoxin
MWRVTVDDTCIGSGSCVGISPAHFALGEDNRSHPLCTQIEPDDAVLDAVASCPVEAIRVMALDTGEIVEP